MSMVPTTRRQAAGRYVMRSGDETVDIYRLPRTGTWMAKPRRFGNRHAFRTKRAASEWAYDWLAEHA